MEDAIDVTEAREFIISSLIPQTNNILNRFFNSQSFSATKKNGVDFKTQADDEVDTLVINSLKKRFPNSNFLTEETAPKDYSGFKNKKNVWIVDPLDGTTNFSRGDPHFATSIALVDGGITKLAIVSIPQTNEVYWADNMSQKTMCNNEVVVVSQTNDVKTAVVACDWSWDLEKRKNIVRWLGTITQSVRQIKCMGSAVVDLAWLASGKLDTYIHSGLKPWDVAACGLLVQKSGGMITTPAGDVWDVFCSDILATNGLLHRKMLDLIL